MPILKMNDYQEDRGNDVRDLNNNFDALDEFAKCMDPVQHKSIANWKKFAFALGVPPNKISECGLYECSPTKGLFKYLETVCPEMTVGELRFKLTGNPERNRTDLGLLLKDLDEKLTVSEAITNSTSNLLDQFAVELDSASRPTCSWEGLGLELDIQRDKLEEIKMYTEHNPTKNLFQFLYTSYTKPVKASVIMEFLQDMKRRDILADINKLCPNIDMKNTDAQEVFKLGSELLHRVSLKLDGESYPSNGWRKLAELLLQNSYLKETNIISWLKPPRQNEIHSPTKKVVEYLSASHPTTPIKDLISACEEIERKDAAGILIKYFVSDDIDNQAKCSQSPPLTHAVQETIASQGNIFKGQNKSFGLPNQIPDMIGRDLDKKDMIEAIHKGDNALVVLHARPGLGKGALAAAVGHELTNEPYNYLCIYVSAEDVFSVEDLATKILTTCGIPSSFNDGIERVKLLFENVGRKCLLILGNIDQAFYATNKPNCMPESTGSLFGLQEGIGSNRIKGFSTNHSHPRPSHPVVSSTTMETNVPLQRQRAQPRTERGDSDLSPESMDTSEPYAGLPLQRQQSDSIFSTGRGEAFAEIPPVSMDASMSYAGLPLQRQESDGIFSSACHFPKQWARQRTGREEYLLFIEEILKFCSNVKILATTWESFSVGVNTKPVSLPPLSDDDSKELLIRRCESVCGIERSKIDSSQLQSVLDCCSGNPQLIRNIAHDIAQYGFEDYANQLAVSPWGRKLSRMCSEKLSKKQRINESLDICFERLPSIKVKEVLVMLSVLPGSFKLRFAAEVFKGCITNDDYELQDALARLMDFGFVTFDVAEKSYSLSFSVRSFSINKSAMTSSCSKEFDAQGHDLNSVYKGAISRFAYHTFAEVAGIESEFFTSRNSIAIAEYRKLARNVKEIAKWCMYGGHFDDPDMKQLRIYIIDSFIQTYSIGIKLIDISLMKTILCRFTRFSENQIKGTSIMVAKKQYVECLIYGGVTCIIGCLCLPHLCPTAQSQAMFCFGKALGGLGVSAKTQNCDTILRIVSDCDDISKEAKAQFLCKFGKILVRQGYTVNGLGFIRRGIDIRQEIAEKTKSSKDYVMQAVAYNDFAGAHSYNNFNGTAINIRVSSVLPVFRQYLGDSHPYAASALSHLAHDYRVLNLHKLALNACNKALSSRKALLGDHSDTARSLFDKGCILKEIASQSQDRNEKESKYRESLHFLKEALEMRENLVFTSKEKANNHSEIADVLMSLGEEEEARCHMQKVVDCNRTVDLSHME